MKAVMLAAGCGARMGEAACGRPKALLEVEGVSLLERHARNLAAVGVGRLVLVTGYGRAHMEKAAAALSTGGALAIDLLHNPDWREGSVVSLWRARDALADGETSLLMDADVLYDLSLLARLVATPLASCFLVDRNDAPDGEAVKLCLDRRRDGGYLVRDFHKRLRDPHPCAVTGESVGFFRLSPASGGALARRSGVYASGDGRAMCYEEALRDVALADADFGVEDISGLPWIEIDDAVDLKRARREIAPRLAALPPRPPRPPTSRGTAGGGALKTHGD